MEHATDTDAPEIWTTPEGVFVELHPVPNHFDDEDGGWFPEEPGQRPPQSYELRDANGSVALAFTVFPNEPWSPYEAASDKLVSWGFAPPASEPDALCEHGLSASLCSGPNHYDYEFGRGW